MTTSDRFLVFVFVFFASWGSALAQEQMIVNRVRFAGNENVRAGTLETLVRTQANRELFSIPGFKVWLWVNSLNGNWGEAPFMLDRITVAADIERISGYYRSIGYLDNRVDTIITEFTKGKVEVSFLINEGNPSEIQTVTYSGFPDFDDATILQRFYRRSNLADRRIDDSTYTVQKTLDYDLIGLERIAIIELLKNNGYASVSNDSIRAIIKRDSLNPTQIDMMFRITPGQTYTFGDVFLNLSGPTGLTKTPRYDTLQTENGSYFARKDEEALSRFRLLYSNVSIEPGTPYNHEMYLQTIRRYQNLGMLNVQQFSLSEDGTLPNFALDTLPVRIDMQTIPRQRIRSDIFGMQRFGFGAGAGIVYTNNNLFGMAEALEIGAKGSFENAPSIREDLLRSFEGNVVYSVPKLHFPLNSLNDRSAFVNSRTRYGITVAQVSQLNFTVNANIRFNMTYDVQHRPTLSSTLELIELDWLDASPSDSFRVRINRLFPENPFQRERILSDFSQQFNSTIRYTIRSFNTDFIKRNRGSVNEFSIESGGNIPWLIEKYLVRPGEPLQGTIPSFTFSDSTLSYARYVKASYDHRRYFSFFDNTVFAWRFYGGAAYAYAETSQIPLNRRFFAGGSNDIRGWRPLRLGPGDVPEGAVTVNGGDVKLATFVELRHLLLRNVISTNWHIAGFVDVGNIWYGPGSIDDRGRFNYNDFYKELAVGAGLGVRLDWEYIIFRIDVAYKIHDPSVNTDGKPKGWFNSPGSYIHFGIGHSF